VIRTWSFSSLVLALCLVAATAGAQRQQVLDLNRQAMDHYNNLEIDQAEQKLQQALRVAERRGVEGAPLARTHLNMGVVAVGGMGDNAAGMQHFEAALRVDPSVQLDPLTSTPDIQTVFNLAKNRVGGGSSSGGGGATGNIPHMPVPEQLAQTAVPVYVEVPSDAPVSDVYVYYKGHGMRDFRRVEMRPVTGGYGFEIPCADVYQPKIQYYIVAFGSDGSPLGFAGTAEAPVEVPIVATRTTSAPALPGAAPPEQCTETECPPGMEGCSRGGGGGMGDTCLSASECNDGLSCQDNFCVADDDDDDDDGPSAGWFEESSRFFAQVSFAAGLSFVSSGMYADGEPQSPPLPGEDDVYIPEGTGDCVDNADGFQDYCVRVETPGLVMVPGIRFGLGAWILDWLGLEATMRIAFSGGQGTLANMLIGGRVIGRVTAGLDNPLLDIRLHLGTTVGQIQPQPPQNGAPEPFIRSGLNGIDFGAAYVANFNKHIAIFVEVDAQFLFPVSLFNLDLNFGLQAGF